MLYRSKLEEIYEFLNDASNLGNSLAEYRILEFQYTQDENQNYDESGPYQNKVSSNPLLSPDFISHKSELKIVVKYKFFGPCFGEETNSNSNYGLYVGKDKEISKMIYYFKDTHRNLRVKYFQLENASSESIQANNGYHTLRYICDCKQNIPISVHTPNFEYFLESDNFNSIKIKKCSFIQKSSKNKRKGFAHGSQSKFSEFASDANQDVLDAKEQVEEDKFDNMNEQFDQFLDSSNPYCQFISNNKILFINQDNMMMCYNARSMKESFNITQCTAPNYSDPVSLEQMIKVKSFLERKSNASGEFYYHVVGENSLILEKGIEYQQNQYQKLKLTPFDRVAPNNFNKFFKSMDDQHQYDNNDEHSELRFLQNHYKQKIEINKRSYYGYIFQSKEFLGEQWSTQVSLVKSFNFYSFRSLILISRRLVSLDQFSVQQLKELSFAQLPNGETLIHMIRDNQSSVDYLLATLNYQEETDQIPFYIPFLEDQEGKNVFDYVFEQALIEEEEDDKDLIDKLRSSKSKISSEIVRKDSINGEFKRAPAKKNDQNLIDLGFQMIDFIGSYPFDLFKVKLIHLCRVLIKKDVEKFAVFLEKRTKQPQFLKGINVGKTKNNQVYIFQFDELWQVNDENLRKIVRQEDSDNGPIKLKVLDIPFIHIYNKKEGFKDNVGCLYEKLQEIDSTSIFDNGVIKALIEVKFRYVKDRIMIMQLIPFIVFMAVLLTYTIRDYHSYETVTLREIDLKEPLIMRIVLLAFVSYFLLLEMIQMPRNPKKYFKNFWNYMDLIGFFLIIAAEILLYFNKKYNISEESELPTNEVYITVRLNDYNIRICYAASALILWNRFLYFFRIFRSMGYYIRMLTEVCKDILHFIFILACVVVAFAHSFMLFGRNNSSGDTIDGFFMAVIDSYIINDVVSDVLPDYQNWVAWIFFLLSSVATNIVLMNLLISIIGNTFDRIKDNYKVMMYKDMVHLVQENRYLYKGLLKQRKHKGKYLFMSVPQDEEDKNAPLIQKLDEIKQQCRHSIRMLAQADDKLEALERIEEKEKQTHDKIEKIEEKQRLIEGSLGEGGLEDKIKKIMDEKVRHFNLLLRKKQKTLEDKQDLILEKLKHL